MAATGVPAPAAAAIPLFGLLGPVVLAYMTWETAKIRSTQSATGILYVDFFTVIVGEVLAKYLLVATTVPV